MNKIKNFNQYFSQSKSFLTFLKSVKPDGLCVLGIDSPAVAACIPALLSPTVTYGLHEMADYRAVDIHYQGLQTAIKIKRPEQKALDIVLNLPGEHNVQNALAAVAVTSELKISDKKIQEALLSFQGVGRRFHLHGDIKLNKGKALLLDDYGHHPTAIDYVFHGLEAGFVFKNPNAKSGCGCGTSFSPE